MSTIAVTGATGHIGSALVHHLLKAGHRVVAVSRASERLDALQTAGAEVRVVDVATDAAGLTEALRGTDAAFLMIPPHLNADDFLAHAEVVAANLEAAVRASGVPRVVQLSSLGGDRTSGTGPILTAHHLENRLKAIDGLNLLILRPTYFMENLLSSIGMIKGMGINGGPQAADAAIPMIATADIAAYAAKRINALDWSGTEVQELLGDRDYSLQEATQLLGKAIGRAELPYVQFPYADAEQGMIGAGLSPSMASLYVEMARGVNEAGLFRNVPRDAESTTPTSLETWIAQAYVPAFNG
jgi:uncharacterized protein YbjT (DUF2867 family)